MLLRGSEPGDAVDAETEFGSSEYAKEILGELWGFPPALELEKEADLQRCIIDADRPGMVDSAHDCSEGGLGRGAGRSLLPERHRAQVELKSRRACLPSTCSSARMPAGLLVSCDRHCSRESKK